MDRHNGVTPTASVLISPAIPFSDQEEREIRSKILSVLHISGYLEADSPADVGIVVRDRQDPEDFTTLTEPLPPRWQVTLVNPAHDFAGNPRNAVLSESVYEQGHSAWKRASRNLHEAMLDLRRFLDEIPD